MSLFPGLYTAGTNGSKVVQTLPLVDKNEIIQTASLLEEAQQKGKGVLLFQKVPGHLILCVGKVDNLEYKENPPFLKVSFLQVTDPRFALVNFLGEIEKLSYINELDMKKLSNGKYRSLEEFSIGPWKDGEVFIRLFDINNPIGLPTSQR